MIKMLNDAVLFDRFSSHMYNMYVARPDVGIELSNGFWNSVPCPRWAKPLLIGHSACWPDGLRTLTDLGTNPGLKGVFQVNWTSGHAMGLNSRTGIEGSPVSSLDCDRPLHSGSKVPELVMDAGCRDNGSPPCAHDH